MNQQCKIAICSFGVKDGAVFGREELIRALQDRKVCLREKSHWTTDVQEEEVTVAIGTSADIRIQVLLAGAGKEAPQKPESLLCCFAPVREGRVLVLAGADNAGLMYLLLEMARRIQNKGPEALTTVEEFYEEPDNAVRCMDRYIVGHLDNEWFRSEEFWQYYLKRLARARFNRLCLIVGFDTPYMAPPYPFFLPGVEGFEQIRPLKFTQDDAEENLKALRRVVELCHEYSIQFVFATWQQRPWTKEQDTLVAGLPEDEKVLSDYCYAGLKALLKEVPDIDIVSFRVNHESGVGTQVSAADFWNHCADAVADAGAELGRDFILDLRAKGLTEEMVAHAYSRGLQVEVPTKYWCEHAALPYHLSIMRSEELEQLDNYNHSRRYSYADMLEKPLRYPVIFRLWNYGSTNLFLWGDADYARRFSQSCALSGSSGFQVNAPLALKYGYEQSHKEAWQTFADPSLRPGRWEDERFFSWYTMFGRLGYNAQTEPEVWGSEFVHHFGEKAEAAQRALQTASRIVPLVTTVHMPVHPSLRYWTELNTGWALFRENNLNEMQKYDHVNFVTYGSTEPSDHGLFYGIDEYASDLTNGRMQGKYTPLQYAGLLFELAEEAENEAKQIPMEENLGNPETLALAVDVSMLVSFARYHGMKIYAAFALAMYKQTKEASWLSDAALHLEKAIEHWNDLSDAGYKYYYHDLDFSTAGSTTRRGTWKDLTRELLADQETIQRMMKEEGITATEIVHAVKTERAPVLYGDWTKAVKAGEKITIRVETDMAVALRTPPVLHYRHVNQTEGLFKEIVMECRSGGYEADIPASYVTANWDLMVYVTAMEDDRSCRVFPGIYHPEYPYPYHVIEVRQQ